MDFRLWNVFQRWNDQRPTQRQGVHEFNDGAMHSTLLIAVLAVAALAVVELASVSVNAWRLAPVVIQGKSQPQPLPSAPAPLQPVR